VYHTAQTRQVCGFSAVILPNPYCHKINYIFPKATSYLFSSADEATALIFKNMQLIDSSQLTAILAKYEYITYPEFSVLCFSMN